MSSVQSFDRCPKCGGHMFIDYYYHTGEEYRCCYRCGMTQSWEIERDVNGEAKCDEHGKLIGKYTESIGYGSAYIEDNESHIGSHYFLNEPLSEQAKEELLGCMKENVTENSYLVTFDPETNEFTPLFGEIPPDFSDEL